MSSTVGRFLGNTVGEAAAFAAGVAIAPVLHPIVQSLSNEAWSVDPTRPLDPPLIAQAVAHGHIGESEGAAEALLGGVSNARFAELVKAARTGPGVQGAFELWRRGRIDDGQFDGALTLAGIEPQWIALLHDLKDTRLDPAVIALAIVRGIMADPGFLPVGPPTTEGRVKAFPTSPLDTLAEAAGSGWNRERLFVQTAVSGRPMGPEAAAAATFRNILERVDFDRAVSEGDVRNEWADAIFEASRTILSPTDYVAARLRAWITTAEMHAGAGLHGMAAADADLLLLIHGRPLSFHQVFIGLRRGGVYDGPTTDIAPAFLKALEESDIRPEWYSLAWAQRYSYPSAFVLRALTQAGDLTQAQTEQILLYEGWEPGLAATVSAKWAGGTVAAGKQATKAELDAEYEGGFVTEAEYRAALTALGYTGTQLDLEAQLGAARRTKGYRDKVVAAIHDAFLVHEIDAATAAAQLTQANVTGEAQSLLLAMWQLEQAVTVRPLTEAQIVKAYKRGTFTEQVALGRLADLGVTAADAATLLADA